MKKMYIAIIDEAPDYMVPTLVAHSMLNAHEFFTSPGRSDAQRAWYTDWWRNSFRKVVVKVPGKVFDRIRDTLTCWAGHENTICNGAATCLVIDPVESDNVPNDLKWATLWKPAQPEQILPPLPEPIKHPAYISDDKVVDTMPSYVQGLIESVAPFSGNGVLSTVHEYSECIASIRIGYWRVRTGDTLSHIGMYTGTDWRELARINELQNPDLIYPGQLIRLR